MSTSQPDNKNLGDTSEASTEANLPEGVLPDGTWPISDEEWEEIERRMEENNACKEEDEDLQLEEEREVDPSATVKWLVALRGRREVSQREMADRMEMSQSAVSRLENGKDVHLSIVEVASYLDALDMSCTLKVYDDEMPIDVQIRRTVMDVMRLTIRLHRLLRMRGVDRRVLEEIERFIGGGISPILLDALDSGLMDRDAVFGPMHMELAPGA